MSEDMERRHERRRKIEPAAVDAAAAALDGVPDEVIKHQMLGAFGGPLLGVLIAIIGFFAAHWFSGVEERQSALDQRVQSVEKSQRHLVRNVDRMTVFFEAKFGMPKAGRVGRSQDDD